MLEFDDYGRIKYNPKFHAKSGTPWSYEDEKYLIDWYEIIGIEELSFALERPEANISSKIYKLKREGKIKRNRKGKFNKRLIPRR
ncbi:hypothetical protein [Clostridium septicum]|uniref:Uncharacterized protein n=1 Tax=Clostridium septicum TaxID=1504 RepID=A0A9N7JMA7_CLOSE|nr:hypothetical protein [Clostridium septicum]AYE35279.1 hypothetical protein CP523_13070 [Clostridium septicum]MDU1313906.1 hypothetical protein [Clostridium septicum]QAS60673.1 hypothetical protein EI377_07940 [Clostridium septicum]UEC20069.1 hypothetical protein LK444_11720 [Clostridium septicum]USS01875.1 hypothetical protein NH397_05450 [Clostridium septicum]